MKTTTSKTRNNEKGDHGQLSQKTAARAGAPKQDPNESTESKSQQIPTPGDSDTTAALACTPHSNVTATSQTKCTAEKFIPNITINGQPVTAQQWLTYIKRLQVEPTFTHLLQPLNRNQYNGLKVDIIEHGCLDPIMVWEDKIIDGEQRYRICMDCERPFSIREVDFECAIEAARWRIDRNRNRRQMDTFASISAYLDLMEGKLVNMARLRQQAGGRKGGQKGDSGTDVSVEQKIWVNHFVAKQVGSNAEYVRLVRKIRKDPDTHGHLIAKLQRKEMELCDLQRILRKPRVPLTTQERAEEPPEIVQDNYVGEPADEERDKTVGDAYMDQFLDIPTFWPCVKNQHSVVTLEDEFEDREPGTPSIKTTYEIINKYVQNSDSVGLTVHMVNNLEKFFRVGVLYGHQEPADRDFTDWFTLRYNRIRNQFLKWAEGNNEPLQRDVDRGQNSEEGKA